MSTSMSRGAAEYWWNQVSGLNIEIPSNVVSYSKNHSGAPWEVFTWEDLHEQRTNRINSNINRKRLHPTIKPCLIWVFSHEYWMMGGYYTVIKTINREYYLNFKGRSFGYQTTEEELQLKVMQIFPLCLPMIELFYDWMFLFAQEYNNRTFYKGWKKQGTAKGHCKIDGVGNLIDIYK